MIEYNHVVPVNAKIRCVGARDYRNLTKGKVYTCLNGLEEGIFTSRPFVTVTADDGKLTCAHASRFEIVKDDDAC